MDGFIYDTGLRHKRVKWSVAVSQFCLDLAMDLSISSDVNCFMLSLFLFIFIINFDNISHLFLIFLLLTF